MHKEVRFNVKTGNIKFANKYKPEYDAIHEFNASEHKNMLLEYDNERETKNAIAYIGKRIIKEERLPLIANIMGGTNVLISRKPTK